MKKELYKETGYLGIKQRIDNGKYVVSMDMGRQCRMNKKTGGELNVFIIGQKYQKTVSVKT